MGAAPADDGPGRTAADAISINTSVNRSINDMSSVLDSDASNEEPRRLPDVAFEPRAPVGLGVDVSQESEISAASKGAVTHYTNTNTNLDTTNESDGVESEGFEEEESIVEMFSPVEVRRYNLRRGNNNNNRNIRPARGNRTTGLEDRLDRAALNNSGTTDSSADYETGHGFSQEGYW